MKSLLFLRIKIDKSVWFGRAVQQMIYGYIVQQFDEDAPFPPMAARKLFPVFAQALRYAQGLAEDYQQNREEEIEGPFEVYRPSKQSVDISGFGVVFRSRDVYIWIEAILGAEEN